MKEFIFKNKNLLMVLSIILVLATVVLVFINKNKTPGLEQQEQLTNTEAIPTVDSNVKVNLEEADRRGELILTIDNAPTGTTSIEYQLTYDAISKEEDGNIVPRGVIGKCVEQLNSKNSWNCQQPNSGEAIILGSCSSGTCVYDNITGDINVQLKFIGEYGERIYEKDFKI